ncbi:cytochrome P450 [Rhizoclosmatium globosum]|uniref:Cytochrome P450 n=1 Tax=Rhizoclosmatium globosum TaxID=329046 RepID=A0A1Y2D195_9FUNG|nr:cytochrome P450 [Rhizoclosmatium globosum]|eukprot:ORY52904.1 cytochrome P450 [Rhizoclosmatium globosum]
MLHTFSIIGLTAAAAAVGIIVHAIFKSTGMSRKNGFPNSPWNWPIIGQTLWFLQGPPKFYDMLASRGPTDAINSTSFGLDQLMMVSPEAMKWAGMKGPGSALRSLLPPRWDRVLGANSLMTTDNAHKHKRLRHAFGLSITKDVLGRCFPYIRQNAQTLINELAVETQNTNKPVEVYAASTRFAFNAIIFLIFGSRSKDVEVLQGSFETLFTTWLAGLGDYFVPEFMNGPFAKSMVARKEIVDILSGIMEERREGFAADDDTQEPDGLNNILFGNSGETLTDDEILDNILVLVFAGHDTSTATMCSSIHFWANVMSQEEKDLLNDEIERADGSNMAELLALPVLDAFLKEVLRMATPATGMFRKLNQDVEFLGHHVPAGTVLTLPFGTLMHNPDVFEDPHTFTIHRFLNKSAQDLKKHAYNYLPFGLGPHQCLGMNLARLEIKIFIFELLKSYAVVKSNMPSEFVGFPALIFKPKVKVFPVNEY